MKASRATVAANPEMQLLQHVMAISRTWASKPNTAEPAARTRATMWRTRAYVIHFTTALGICTGSLFPTKALISTKIDR